MFVPPECGPEALTIAPETTSTRHAGTPASATHRHQRGPIGAAQPERRLQASNATATAPPSATSASRKWLITSSGWSLKMTVIPPSGI